MSGYLAIVFTVLCAVSGVAYAIHSSRFMAFVKQFGDSGFYHMTKGAVYIYYDHEDFPADHTDKIQSYDQQHTLLFRATIILGIAAIALQVMSR